MALLKRRWQRCSTTTNICGTTLAPRQFLPRWIEHHLPPRSGFGEPGQAAGALRSQAPQALQQRGSKGLLRSQTGSQRCVRQEERQGDQARQGQAHPRLRVEAHLTGRWFSLRSEAMPLFQLFDGMCTGGQVPVQAHVHGLRGRSPYGGQPLNFQGQFGSGGRRQDE